MELLNQLIFNKIKLFHKDVKCASLSRISSNSELEGHNRIGRLSHFIGRMGNWSYIGDNCSFFGSIGRYCSIASNVKVINGRHAFKRPFVSTCPLFFSKKTKFGFSFVKEQKFIEFAYADDSGKYHIIVGNDVWIGEGVGIIQGVTIHDGAVVLAQALVTKDVPPYAIVGGVPAKIIGYRYDEETISKLLELKWWDKDEEWIRRNAELFSDLENFLKLK